MEIDVYEMLYEATTSKCQANSSASVTTGPARRPQRTRSKTTGESDSEEAGKEEELVELLSEHLIDDAIMDENGLEENFQCLDFDTETNARYRAWWNTTDRYDCRICEQKFFAPSNLANHYRKHLLSKNEYLERYGTLKTHSSDFQCHECKTTIPFIRHKVVHHLRNHDQSPADYFKYFLNTELLVKNREFHSWLLGCEFSCRVCNKKCMNDVSLSKHIKSEHGISGLGEYERLHGHRMSKVVKRSCAICKELIEWYPSKIARHLFSNHELTLTKYFYFHVKDNHQRIYDESKSETWHNSETQEAADGEAYRLSVSRTSSKIGERVFQCQICEKKARGPTLFQKHLKAKHLDLQEQPDFGEVSESNGVPVHYLKRYKTKFQWNQCKRFCPICDKEFNNYNAIYKHVTKVHKQTCTELKTNEKDILIKHTCLLCGSALRFEDKVFRWHLKKTHQTTIEDYEELFHSELEDVFESLEPSDALDVTVAPSPRFPWNQSKRYCTICLKVSTSLSTHMKHVSTIHDKSFRDLKPSKKDVIVSHLCFLCDDKIRFELVDIKRHMTVKHEITLVDYECQFSTVLKAVFSIFESGSPKRASKVPTIINNIEDEADNNCIEVVPSSPTCNDDIQFETVKVEDLDENNTEIPDTKNMVSIFEETTASRVAENVINEFDGMIKVEYDHEGL